MTDEHEKLTVEYERLVQAFAAADFGSNAGHALQTVADATRHILYRLGPPDPMDAVDADVRKTLEA